MSAISQWLAQVSRGTQKCFYIFQLDGVDLLRQLKFEEFLYRRVAPVSRGCMFFLTNNHRRTGSKAVVMGFSGKEQDFVKDPEYARSQGISIIRRFTGGGTVIVDECSINTSIIASTKFTKNMSPTKICNWTYENIFRGCGVFNDRFDVVEGDYVVRDIRIDEAATCDTLGINKPSHRNYFKVAGNSQACNVLAFVHHSVFLWEMSPLISQVLLHPKKTPVYREGRDHASFLRSVKDAVNSEANINSIDDFEYALCESAGRDLLWQFDRKARVIVSVNPDQDGDIRDTLRDDTVVISDTFIDDAVAMLDRGITQLL